MGQLMVACVSRGSAEGALANAVRGIACYLCMWLCSVKVWITYVRRLAWAVATSCIQSQVESHLVRTDSQSISLSGLTYLERVMHCYVTDLPIYGSFQHFPNLFRVFLWIFLAKILKNQKFSGIGAFAFKSLLTGGTVWV